MIGLEIHVQLRTKSKLFCSCSTSYRSAEPNRNICPVCTGQPGSKPWAVNKAAVDNVIKLAVALGSRLNLESPVLMQRKHYFYPDLPSGYQRTSKPLAVGGQLSGVRFRELHLEEDPGQFELREGTVDFNRSGIPLVEIVTEPDFNDPKHAREFLEELSSILDYLGVASLEPGSMRIDANLSVAGNNRVEVKNINSFKGVFTALTFEAARQRNMVKNNLPILQETRHFDEGRGTTVSLRKKETAEDYRYFPDPDVPPMVTAAKRAKELEALLPELPSAKRARFTKQYRILPEEASAITMEKGMADSYEQVALKVDPKTAANFFRGVLRKQLNYRNLTYTSSDLTPGILVELLGMLSRKDITEKVAEQLLIAVIEKKAAPQEHARKHGLIGVHSEKDLAASIDNAILQSPKAVEDYKSGKGESLNFLAGHVMKASRGKADPAAVQALLKKKLSK